MIRGERIRARLDALNCSQAALAREIGVSPQAVSKMVTGDTTDSAKLWQIARFLKTTPEYLAGEADQPHDKALAQSLPAPTSGGHEEQEEVEIDMIDLGFGMGGTFLDVGEVEVQKARFSRHWLRQFTPTPPNLLFTAQGVGDSMMPTILDGDVVIIDRSETRPEFGDKIWAITFGGVGMIKRLRPMPDGTMKISSDNQLVRDDVAADGELSIVGRVVAIVRKV